MFGSPIRPNHDAVAVILMGIVGPGAFEHVIVELNVVESIVPRRDVYPAGVPDYVVVKV